MRNTRKTSRRFSTKYENGKTDKQYMISMVE